MSVMKVNRDTRVITDFGDYDIDELYAAIKNIAGCMPKKDDNPELELKAATLLESAIKDWAKVIELRSTPDNAVSLFIAKALISIIEMRGLKEWKSPFI